MVRELVHGMRSGSEARLIQQILDAKNTFDVTGNQIYMGEAENALASLVALHEEQQPQSRMQKAVRVITGEGVWHSRGTGIFSSPGAGMGDIGYIKTSPQAARLAVNAYEHLEALRNLATQQPLGKNVSNLQKVLRQAYVPVPREIDSISGVAVGPIRLSRPEGEPEAAVHFLRWVQGLTLEDLFVVAEQVTNGMKTRVNQLLNKELLAVAQMTGVWQARPYLPEGVGREGVAERVREEYLASVDKTVDDIVEFTSQNLSRRALGAAKKAFGSLIESMIIDDNPVSGNVWRYFDNNLRNYVVEVNRGDPLNFSDILNDRVDDHGDAYYPGIFAETKRIDLTNWSTLWGIESDDFAHIVMNPHVSKWMEQDRTATSKIYAMMVLTRKTIVFYDMSRRESRREEKLRLRNQANKMAAELVGIYEGASAESQPAFTEHYKRNRGSADIAGMRRAARQACLEMVYYGKGLHLDRDGGLLDGQVGQRRLWEATRYFEAAGALLSKAAEAAGLPSNTKGIKELEGILCNAHQRIASGRIDTKALETRGGQYLQTLI
jgi:hypothetical protein